MSFKEFMELGAEEVEIKIGSLPKTEPLYEVIQSRVINLAKIKDKEERKKWRSLKKINKIPDEYLDTEEIYENLKEGFKKNDLH